MYNVCLAFYKGGSKILRHDFHGWSDSELIDIVHVCVILHDMLVRLRVRSELEDETDGRGVVLRPEEVVEEFLERPGDDAEREGQTQRTDENWSAASWLQHLMGMQESVRDRSDHIALRCAVEDHVWESVGAFAAFNQSAAI